MGVLSKNIFFSLSGHVITISGLLDYMTNSFTIFRNNLLTHEFFPWSLKPGYATQWLLTFDYESFAFYYTRPNQDYTFKIWELINCVVP